ncbi:MAG: hypothetical protein LBB76_05675 [Azoarcus sp.]|jgi:hypothetical protein|nr:hypothetical protein [Azoarcus sp.]
MITVAREEAAESNRANVHFVDALQDARAEFSQGTHAEVAQEGFGENISFGSLVEYPESEAAQTWTEYWRQSCGIARRIKHYRWLFLSENLVLEVFAEGVQWGDHSS